jgi:hypothetical protein
VFRQLTTEVERTGLPSRSFGHILTAAAVALAQLMSCNQVLAEKGTSYETTTTTGALKIVARPELATRNTSLRILKGLLAELGLTPLAIGRVDRTAIPKARTPRQNRFFGLENRDAEKYFYD